MANATRRCAIYTRKSSEEGLEQDYNSLHAQREACEAFIRSQAGEGWRLIKTAYDDGGFSGAGMERPGLQQLLASICEGLVDIVSSTRSIGLPARLPTSPGWSNCPTQKASHLWPSPSSSTPPPRWVG